MSGAKRRRTRRPGRPLAPAPTGEAPRRLRVVHRLPGRLRMRFSRPLADDEALCRAVQDHEGVVTVSYTTTTTSLLVRYDATAVEQSELVVRTALAFTLDGGVAPVTIEPTTTDDELSTGALAALACGMTALAARGLTGNGRSVRLLEGVFAGATGLTVLHHGLDEVRRRGNFDPEVLSLVYLLTAVTRGEVLWPTFVTWVAAFGRHVLEPPPAPLVVTPVALTDGGEATGRYEFTLGRSDVASARTGVTRTIRRAILSLAAGGGPHALLDELRDVARAHGDVLEGLPAQPDGIPVRFIDTPFTQYRARRSGGTEPGGAGRS